MVFSYSQISRYLRCPRIYGRFPSPEQHSHVLASTYYTHIGNKMVRYQSAINRQLFQAMSELDRLQEKRKSEAQEAK
jgi:hypothetical protein